MKQFRMIIAMVILISSIVIFAMNFLSSQAIQIILDTGQVVTTSSNYFTLTKALILATTSFFIGGTITYLFYNSDEDIKIFPIGKKKEKDDHDAILPFLKPNEKKVFMVLKENKGEMLQNKLVLELGLSKVKTTRILASLQAKNLIEKHRYGMTNKIKLIK